MDPSLEHYNEFFSSRPARSDYQTHSMAVPEPPSQVYLDPDKMASDSDSLSSSVSSPVVSIHQSEGELEKATTHHTTHSAHSGAPQQRITTAQDWSGLDDPGNPINWALSKKAYHVAMLGSQCFTTTFGSSVISPSLKDIAKQFDVSTTASILPLTLYVLGLAFGPMISAPISETFGRRVVYMALFPPSLLFTLGAGFSHTFGALCACRFLAGALGSGCLAVGAGTNSDIWLPHHRAAASSVFLLAPFLGPALGPPIGGFVSMEMGWRWTQWTILFAGTASWLFGVFQDETYKKIILLSRAKKLGLPPPPGLPTGWPKWKFILTVTVLRPARMLVTEPIVALLSIYTAFNFSVLFAFFAAFPLVFQSPYPEIQVYHFNRGESGLVFLGIGLGSVLSTIAFIVIDRLTYQKKAAIRRAGGDMSPLPPEERLQSAMVGAFLLPVGLFWFAWSARSDVHWISPVLATIPFGMGNLMVFCSVVLYLIDTYGPMGGASAAAANGILRYVAGAVFPLWTIQMYRAMGVAWGTSLLGFVTVGLCALPFLFYRFGARIRQRSAYTP